MQVVAMSYADLDGWQLVITDTGGEGPPVLLVHGASHQGAAAGAYDHQIAGLSAVYRVLTVQVRDDVQQPPSDAWGPARALFLLLDTLGIERVVLCGADDTAELLVRAALLHPDRVRGLGLIHPDLGAVVAAASRPGADPDLDDLDARLDELAMPVLVIQGDDDPARPVTGAQRLAELVSDPRGVVEVPGAGVTVATSHAERVTGALRDYLEGLPA